jgi:uncharacterized MAPEG superfamily protein
LTNLQEALPVFLTLALLHVGRGSIEASALYGAWTFFVARALYVPAYLSGIAGIRLAVWVLSWLGLAPMVATLLVAD